jgi:hypothetical protein
LVVRGDVDPALAWDDGKSRGVAIFLLVGSERVVLCVATLAALIGLRAACCKAF